MTFTLQMETIVLLDKALTKVFGTSNERAVKRLTPIVAQINALEPEIQKLSDEQLRAKTVEFRARIAAKLDGITDEDAKVVAEKEALEELLPEASVPEAVRTHLASAIAREREALKHFTPER